LSHLLFTPANGTGLCGQTASGGGGAFIVAGGAPIYISSFNNVEPSSCTAVDESAIDDADGGPGSSPEDYFSHLRFTPADGTFLEGSPGGSIYRVAGGAPLPVTDCSVLDGCSGSVTVDQYSITNAGSSASDPTFLTHLSPTPAEGAVVEGLPSQNYWTYELGGILPAPASTSAVQVNDASLASFPVDVAPAFTSGASVGFIVGASDGFNVAATAVPVATFSESGTLPSGVTLSSTGFLSGVPATGTAGTYPITITASNGISPDAIQNFTLKVVPIGITTTSLPNGSVYSKKNKATYSATLAASGGNPPYTWSMVSGSKLPPGLKLSSTGVISGKAKVAGTYTFTVKVVDTKKKPTSKTHTARAALSITIL
jgi:hypothetical protein